MYIIDKTVGIWYKFTQTLIDTGIVDNRKKRKQTKKTM